MAAQFAIRPARVDDCAAINEIYNHYVLFDTCTYQTEPDSLEERQAWLGGHGGPHPVLVAEQRGQIVGWGSLSPFHPRAAYRASVEDSVYVRHDRQRAGLGRALLKALLIEARALGHHTVVALISAEKFGSVAMHQELGFMPAGHLREAGYKFETWLDVAFMQLML